LRHGQQNLEKNSPNKQNSLKANALLCPVCCVEYVEIEIDFEVEGVILRNVKALRCPACEEEAFTPEQFEAIKQKINP
jgi:YgiT-type zinc finger domain-containing protein